jgi:hypothetical protein
MTAPVSFREKGPQPSQNPALQHAPDALQNGTSLLVRPLRMPRQTGMSSRAEEFRRAQAVGGFARANLGRSSSLVL